MLLLVSFSSRARSSGPRASSKGLRHSASMSRRASASRSVAGRALRSIALQGSGAGGAMHLEGLAGLRGEGGAQHLVAADELGELRSSAAASSGPSSRSGTGML